MIKSRKDILKDILGEYGEDDYIKEDKNDIKKESHIKNDIPKENNTQNKDKSSKHDEKLQEFFNNNDLNLNNIIDKKEKRQEVKMIKKGSPVIVNNDDGPIPVYKVDMPNFSNDEWKLLDEIRNQLVEKAINRDGSLNLEEEDFAHEIENYLRNKGIKKNIRGLSRQLVQEMIGYGRINPLLNDDALEEIMVLGVNKPVYVYHRDEGMMETNIIFKDDDEIKSIIDIIARQCGRRIDKQSPILDARLPDGSRVNATIAPISTYGCTLTIRKFREDPLTIIDLINFKTVTPFLAAFLWVCIDGLGIKPCNAIVAGSTGAGKSSTLNSICSFIPPNERVITIEDTVELQLPIPHVVTMETRPPSLEGTGEITMSQLVVNSLRQRPDRIIIGEVRGPEAATLFTALNTGHSGYGSLHSNTAKETITRLINEPMNVPTIMIPALNFIIMQNRIHKPDGGSIRRITEIAEVVGMEGDNVQLNKVFEYNPSTDTVEYVGISSKTLRDIAEAKAVNIEEVEKEIEKREIILEYMADNNIRSIKEVEIMFNNYFKNPEETFDKILMDIQNSDISNS